MWPTTNTVKLPIQAGLSGRIMKAMTTAARLSMLILAAISAG
jgi:hypothetical protein